MNGERERTGIPLPVLLRTYRVHAVIAAIMLTVCCLLFGFLAGDCTRACAELRRINDAPHSEIIFSGERPAGAESFFYLSGSRAIGEKGLGVSADLLMVLPGETYGENDVYFQGMLMDGTCAVSANLAGVYGLRVGNALRLAGTDQTFRVARLLPAQAGVDKNFDREGIVVLSYDGEAANQASYVSFMTDGDAYPSLRSLVYIEDWRTGNIAAVARCGSVFIVSFAIAVGICEFFLFCARRRDYRLLAEMGERRRKVMGRIWVENMLKYLLPLAATGGAFAPAYACYGAMYAIPLACALAAAFAAVTAYSFLWGRRLFVCRKSAKKL